MNYGIVCLSEMPKKRILEFFSFAGVGGTQQMFLEYLRHASHEHYDFSACILLEHGFLNEQLSCLHVENTSLNSRGYWDLSAWWKLYRFANGKQFDLMRTYGLKAHIIGRIVGKILGIPVNISSVRNTDPWRKWYHALLDFLTSGLSDLYISNSEAGRVATHERERIPLDKIVTVPNGIDVSRFPGKQSQMRSHYRKKFKISPKAPVLGIVANLREQKGHKTIVDAFPRLQKRFPTLRCLFIGEDLLNGEILRYVRTKNLEDSIFLTGSRQDIPEMLSMLDVFVLPSSWEGFPKSILEAMAMKKPVIASAVGGIPEVVIPHETGLLIPPQDPQAFAEAVISVLEDPEKAIAMGNAGYERVCRHFSIENVVSQTETIYEQLIEAKPRL